VWYVLAASSRDRRTIRKADRDNAAPTHHFAAGRSQRRHSRAGVRHDVSLSRGYLTVAIALPRSAPLMSPACATCPFCPPSGRLGAIVAARLAWEPRIEGEGGVGSAPSSMAADRYGVPADAFWQSARLLERDESSTTAVHLRHPAVSFAALPHSSISAVHA